MKTTCVSRSHLDDDKLISRGLKGDQEALHILLMRYRRLLYSLAHRLLRNHEEAEDAVQNCFLQAFRKLECVKCGASFRSWLVRILINEALVIIRRKKSGPVVAPVQYSAEEPGECLEGFPAPGPDPQQKLAIQESAGAFRKHLARPSDPFRCAILICDVGEHAIQEASTVLDLAPNTAKARFRRGRTKLGLAMRHNSLRVNLPDPLIGL